MDYKMKLIDMVINILIDIQTDMTHNKMTELDKLRMTWAIATLSHINDNKREE